MPRVNIGRTFLAVIAGYATNAVLVVVTEQLLSRFLDPTYYLVADVVTQCLSTIVGGYLCCLIAQRSRGIAMAGLIGLGLLVGTVSLVTSWKAEPHWYGVTLLSVYAPCVWIGFMSERRMNNQDHDA
jgi:hypothetical protein